MIYLHKILPIVLLPVGIVLLVVSAGLLLRRRSLIWTGVVVLWVCSTPVVSGQLLRAVEGATVRGVASAAPAAEAIVVLSGGRIVAPGAAAISEWVDADRFFGGMELFQAGKAPLLVFTGGRLPWEPNTVRPEGDILAEYATDLGVPAAGVVTTGAVATTAEEAVAVAALLSARRTRPGEPPKAPRILLVTSAFHMARAQRLFARAGMEVIPFPVDFQVPASGALTIMDFLPSATALCETELAWREMYGRIYYALVR